MTSAPPFGALRPSPAQERARAIGARLPSNYLGRRLASLLLGPAGGRTNRPYDVEIFGGAGARLHPFDNICEKRVYLTPQLWDGEERAALADLVANHSSPLFSFVDIGANAGLYTLFVHGETRRRGVAFRGLCVEADPEMQRRLAFNIEASGAQEEVVIARYAAGARSETLRLAVDEKSRGLTRIAEDGALAVEARPLLRLVEEARLDRVDALKIDIEGHEFPVLEAFLRDAPHSLWPHLFILETAHDGGPRSARELILSAGWREAFSTKRNLVAVL